MHQDVKVRETFRQESFNEKTIPFTYNAKEKHYTGVLKENKAGQYLAKISADVKGKKVDGLFSFNR